MNLTITEDVGATAAAEYCDHSSAVMINAEIYALEFGWRVFPCHGIRNGICTCRKGANCKAPGKHPRTRNGVLDATTDSNKIKKWFDEYSDANLAIATGGTLVGVDVDPRNGGDKTLAKWEAELGPLPRSHIVRTGGGGWHYLLSSSVPIKCGTLGPGVDIKANGGFLIAAPSNHISGGTYRWQGGLSLTAPAPLPKPWLDRLAQEELIVPTGNAQGRVLSVARTPDADELDVYPPTSGLLSPMTGTGKRIWAAARRCLVDERGQTNDKFPALATSLKNLPGLRGNRAEELIPVIHWWFQEGRDCMSDREWDSVKKRWLYLWNEWSEPGVGPAWEAATFLVESGALKEITSVNQPAQAVLQALCTQMQRQAGNGIWYLSCRTAADVLGSIGFAVHYSTVSRWLQVLVVERYLVKPWSHESGSLRAQRYQTAEVAAQCEQHDRRREQRQHAIERIPTLVFPPINWLAQIRVELPPPTGLSELPDFFSRAGRDEPALMPKLVFSLKPSPVASIPLSDFHWNLVKPARMVVVRSNNGPTHTSRLKA